MSYLTGRSWYTGGKRKAETARRQAAPGTRLPQVLHQSEWLGWDGWVNPEPVQSVAPDSKSVA